MNKVTKIIGRDSVIAIVIASIITASAQYCLGIRQDNTQKELGKRQEVHEKALDMRSYTRQNENIETELLAGITHLNSSKCMNLISRFKQNYGDNYDKVFKEGINNGSSEETKSVNECRIIIRDYWLSVYRLSKRHELDKSTKEICQKRHKLMTDLIQPLDNHLYCEEEESTINNDIVYKLFG